MTLAGLMPGLLEMPNRHARLLKLKHPLAIIIRRYLRPKSFEIDYFGQGETAKISQQADSNPIVLRRPYYSRPAAVKRLQYPNLRFLTSVYPSPDEWISTINLIDEDLLVARAQIHSGARLKC